MGPTPSSFTVSAFIKENIGLIGLKEERWTGFSEGWQSYSEGFPKGEARGKCVFKPIDLNLYTVYTQYTRLPMLTKGHVRTVISQHLLTTHLTPITSHYSPLTTHHWALHCAILLRTKFTYTAMHSMHWTWCTALNALHSMHCTQCTEHDALHSMHCSQCTALNALHSMH